MFSLTLLPVFLLYNLPNFLSFCSPLPALLTIFFTTHPFSILCPAFYLKIIFLFSASLHPFLLFAFGLFLSDQFIIVFTFPFLFFLPSSSSLPSLPSLPALAASSGQLPIPSLEGGAGHLLLGGPGCPAVPSSLRPSLFLNRPTLLPMVTGSMATASTATLGLVSSVGGSGGGCGSRPSFSQSPPPGASNLLSPTSCPEESTSPCSSPASFCSFSEASPPPLGGTMAEWSPTDQSILSGEDEEEDEEEEEHLKEL